MSLAVNVVCRNLNEDRVIPRFGRYLRDNLGWALTARPDPKADVLYLSCYFESQLLKPWPSIPIAAYFTHIETDPPGNGKARLFYGLAERLDLRIATAAMYARELQPYGPTAQITPPVERDRFTIKRNSRRQMTAGFSGYTYSNGRKGERMARSLVGSKLGKSIQWMASGRGWPVLTRVYGWPQMPAFYQSLDILVVTATVEGIPMPPLEALSCGTSVVIPRGVGLLDELPDTFGIHRYQRGDARDAERALSEAIAARSDVNREALRAVTEPYTIEAWCHGHARAFEMFEKQEEVLKNQLSGRDEEILAEVGRAWLDVEAVLGWTARHIPHIKRQIAAYQGAALAYYAHLHNRPGAQFLEIGTAIGYSACLMATAAPKATITTLNPKDGEFEKARDNLKIRSTVKVVKATSEDFFSRPGGPYDLIFVDGDHSYKMVRHDAMYFNRLRPGGLILFHDYSPDGSARPSAGSFKALNDLQDMYRPADVKIIGSGQVGMLGWVRQEGETWK